MNENVIDQLCFACFSQNPTVIRRCAVGIGNYVYYTECAGTAYIVRCASEQNAYNETICWLRKLRALHVPVPKVIQHGCFQNYSYLILTYIEGQDIGLVYPLLTDGEKRTIAKEVVRIQEKVSALELMDIAPHWTWHTFIQDMLDRARERIAQNGYFDTEKVDRLQQQAVQLDTYFSAVKPVAYLDDISSKNLLIQNGHISGIIDIDWMGIGDKLTYVALTNMALLDLEYDTDYVRYILEEMQINEQEKRAFLFYTLLYCVDFMGERGMQFMDKRIDVSPQIVHRLNSIYDHLWAEWNAEKKEVPSCSEKC